ncbi:MAG: hypothetical protein R3325_12950, partial [Thermoanaerobaculia bacterium]|nr:hypothetical protein [Thermoanaerobaculia bacterium]
SPALDAGQIAEFGTLRWQGALPAATRVAFSARSGISARPDRTWSPWTPVASGREIALGEVPAGRYLQWRAELTGDGSSPELSRVTVSYRQLNLPPRIDTFAALDPGEIVVPANFNPANQVFEPAHPNRDGIFTTLKPSGPGQDAGGKTLWKRGYRTLRWSSEDPNGDELQAKLEFRREGETEWLPMAEEIEASFYSFDATVLPDGVYRFRLTVADGGGGDAERSLSAEETSEPVLVDHTPPRLVKVTRDGGALAVEVRDALSPLREAVVSADASEWAPARPLDGLVDGRGETLQVELPEGARMLLLRLTDAAFNVVTFDLLREVP